MLSPNKFFINKSKIHKIIFIDISWSWLDTWFPHRYIGIFVLLYHIKQVWIYEVCTKGGTTLPNGYININIQKVFYMHQELMKRKSYQILKLKCECRKKVILIYVYTGIRYTWYIQTDFQTGML